MNLSDSFDEIYRKNWKGLYLTAYKVLKDRQLCEDIVQEIFSSLWNRRDVIFPDPIEPYLYKSLKFQVYKTLRNAKIKASVWNDISNVAETLTNPEGLEIKELNASMRQSIERLPEKCRAIYKLRREEHFSINDISQQLSISPKTVEGQLTIAFRKLRESLSNFIL